MTYWTVNQMNCSQLEHLTVSLFTGPPTSHPSLLTCMCSPQTNLLHSHSDTPQNSSCPMQIYLSLINPARALTTCCIGKTLGTAGRENKGDRLHYRDKIRTYQNNIWVKFPKSSVKQATGTTEDQLWWDYQELRVGKEQRMDRITHWEASQIITLK